MTEEQARISARESVVMSAITGFVSVSVAVTSQDAFWAQLLIAVLVGIPLHVAQVLVLVRIKQKRLGESGSARPQVVAVALVATGSLLHVAGSVAELGVLSGF